MKRKVSAPLAVNGFSALCFECVEAVQFSGCYHTALGRGADFFSLISSANLFVLGKHIFQLRQLFPRTANTHF
jgi:hypothetical protein